MRILKTHMVILLTTSSLTLGLSACNTIHGLGKDTERDGQRIENEADQHIDGKEDHGHDRDGNPDRGGRARAAR